MADHKKARKHFEDACKACESGDHKSAASHAGHGLNALKGSGMSVASGIAKLKGRVAKRAMKPTADGRVAAQGGAASALKPGFDRSRFAAFRKSTT